MKAISACLLGVACRYDGRILAAETCYQDRAGERLIPVCPEQLGGLPTPRSPAEIVGGSGKDVLDGSARLLTVDGADVTDAFLRGAQETLRICHRLGVREAILKSRSPSCGVGRIQRCGEVVPGDGVTAALLRREGIEVREHPG
ncbi:MAG: DUF523 domain-containing protein [Candidatus Eisenbacteria bacterium]